LSAAGVLQEHQAEDVRVLRVGPLIDICEWFVLGTGRNKRHLRALAEDVRLALKADGALLPGREGIRDENWTLLDFGNVVVHVFSPEARGFYSLDALWSDAEALEVPDPA
jgi:ribosome-associated protein